MKKEKFRDNNFSVLHWIGVVLVIVGHQYVLTGYDAPVMFGMSCHELGVKLLFVVSGYLVTKSFLRTPSGLDFIKKRVNRIFPALIVCLLGIAFLLGPLFTESTPKDYIPGALKFVIRGVILLPYYMLPGVFVDNPVSAAVNGSLWSLLIEVFCYIFLLVWGKIVKCIYNKSSTISKLFMIIIIIIYFVLYILRENGIISDTITVLGVTIDNGCSLYIFFALGSFFATLSFEKMVNVKYGIFFIVVYFVLPKTISIWLTPLAMTYCTLLFALLPKMKLSNFLDNYDNYYESYLWAFPIQQILINICIVKKEWNFTPEILLLFSAVLIFSISYFVSEQIQKPIARLFKS